MFILDDGLADLNADMLLAGKESPQTLMDRAKEAGVTAILLDMGIYRLIDSIQIGLLFGLARCCRQMGIRLMVFGAKEGVAQSLRWVNAQQVMEIHPDREAALDALRPGTESE